MGRNSISNNLKAILKIGDIIGENAPVYQSDCMTVQKFDYAFCRTQDSHGIPYGDTNDALMEISVRIMNKTQVKQIFDIMAKMSCTEFSIMFNTTFDEQLKVSEYEDGMVVRGTLVDIDERFVSAQDENDQQMLLKMCILVAKVTYIGEAGNKELKITEC